jgi:ankyrin repeat protein
VEALIEAGAGVDKLSTYSTSPLWIAASNGHTKIVEALIEAGADVNKLSTYSTSPFLIAASNGHVEIVKTLLQAMARKLSTENENKKDTYLNYLDFVNKDITDAKEAIANEATKNREQIMQIFTEALHDIETSKMQNTTPKFSSEILKEQTEEKKNNNNQLQSSENKQITFGFDKFKQRDNNKQTDNKQEEKIKNIEKPSNKFK